MGGVPRRQEEGVSRRSPSATGTGTDAGATDAADGDVPEAASVASSASSASPASSDGGDGVPLAIVIETARDERVAEGERLAAELGLPILSSRDLTRRTASADLLLVLTREALLVAASHRGRARPGRGEQAYREKGVRVDLGGLNPRPGAGGLSRKQPIARAVGRESGRVIDGTAGFGQDARLLAAMGYVVLATERSPVLHALLQDGLRRAAEDPPLRELLGDRLTAWPEAADVRTVLAAREAAGEPPPDAVYLDPMFPPRRKESALARKSVRMIRALVGADQDAGEVLAAVRQRVRRVVVKRPPDAQPVAEDATLTVASKLARYDVYIDPARPASGRDVTGSSETLNDHQARSPDPARPEEEPR
jgi:16S rRNA (guanine1516-N2)-methyltransferase